MKEELKSVSLISSFTKKRIPRSDKRLPIVVSLGFTGEQEGACFEHILKYNKGYLKLELTPK